MNEPIFALDVVADPRAVLPAYQLYLNVWNVETGYNATRHGIGTAWRLGPGEWILSQPGYIVGDTADVVSLPYPDYFTAVGAILATLPELHTMVYGG
jgi:hypothetical protein